MKTIQAKIRAIFFSIKQQIIFWDYEIDLNEITLYP